MAAAERPFYLLHRALVAIRYSGSLAGAYAQTIPNDAARSRSVRRLKPKRNLCPDVPYVSPAGCCINLRDRLGSKVARWATR